MTYYINVNETYKIYDYSVYKVEADSPQEAYEKYQRGDADFYDTVSSDYGDCLNSEFDSIEDKNGNDLTNKLNYGN